MSKYSENYHTYVYMAQVPVKMTVRDYLVEYCSYSSRLVRKIKREGEIFLNDQKVTLSYFLAKGDRLVVYLGQEDLDANPENIPISIVHEDEDILVLNKEANFVTHATLGHPTGNVANAIAYHWKNIGVEAKIRFVNRLDRDTSGVIVIAKNKFAHQFIQDEMKENKVEKIYWAIVEGVLKKDQDTIDKAIGRPYEDSIERVIMEGGQRAITHYQVIERCKNHTVVELQLETGRTHQIRVHTKGIGHPIIGDNLYNPQSMNLIQRQALHAKSIRFVHPRTREMMKFEADLPRDMKDLLVSGKL